MHVGPLDRDGRAGAEIEQAEPARAIPAAWRYYVLFILTLVLAASILDRQVLNIMVEPIRKELHLTDGAIGLMTGVAFALVYTTLCLPMARLADRVSRRWIVVVAVSIWSVATILCGFAATATQLFMARFAVGFGEAGGSAPSQALLSDIFPRRQRGTVMAAMLLASPIGVIGGLAAGGWALQHYGWRTTFLLAGGPGLVLAPLVAFTFPKVRRGMADGIVAELPSLSFPETIRLLWSIRTLPFLMFGATLQTVVASGINTWVPAFLSRSHHLPPQQIGSHLGLALGLGAFAGSVAGGPLFDWLGRRDLRWHLRVPMITAVAAAAVAAIAFVSPIAYIFPLMALVMVLSGLFAGPLIAITINLAPVHVRATGLASLFFVLNAVGLGIAPWFIGILSDLLKPQFGVESLRVALVCATLTGLPASYLFHRGARFYPADVARIDALNRDLI